MDKILRDNVRRAIVVERRPFQFQEHHLLEILRVPETISGQFVAHLLHLSLQRSLNSEAAQQKAAEKTQETDRKKERKT